MELVFLVIVHLVVLNRIRVAKTAAAVQRATDLERFTKLHAGNSERAQPE